MGDCVCGGGGGEGAGIYFPLKIICARLSGSCSVSMSLIISFFCVSLIRSVFLCPIIACVAHKLRSFREMLSNSPTALRMLKAALNAAEDGHAGVQVRIAW